MTISNQLCRSSSSAALNYGESRSAESKRDFIHKKKLVLKEMRESHVALKIVRKSELAHSNEVVNDLIEECNQLVAIFVTTIRTAERNL